MAVTKQYLIHSSILVVITLSVPSPAGEAEGTDPVSRFELAAPATVENCSDASASELESAAADLEQWAANLTWHVDQPTAPRVMGAVEQLLEAQSRIDAVYERTLTLRTQFVNEDVGEPRRDSIRAYLRMTSGTIDLTARLRYLLRDAIDRAAYLSAPNAAHRSALIQLLIQHQSSMGASVMSVLLIDPPAASGLKPANFETKRQVLHLIEMTRQVALLSTVAEFARAPTTSPELVIEAAEVIRKIGLPQDPRPQSDTDTPGPVITAGELKHIVAASDLPPSVELVRRRRDLLQWLEQRDARGVTGDTFHVGDCEVRAGDWLLMRNPSPYNLFTDLSPGLFTHVGVVAIEEGSDGKRRFVIVDLPERGSHIPANNVDKYLRRTLHFFFMRHEDPAVGRRMGDVALSVVGNETQFDLTFRTQRVFKLKGQDLRDQRIHTYCAGFLVLCAQETSAPVDEFFPIREYPATVKTLTNLGKLGLSIGDDFVSPTGALFSPRLELVARRQPMYDPTREIKEAIYDYFALCIHTKELAPSPTTYQALREKLAAMAQANAMLARLLAKANNVSEHMDLVSAARAAAVIETLDEIADGNMEQFIIARRRVLTGSAKDTRRRGLTNRPLSEAAEYRQRHASLYERWSQRKMTPRQLRMELVDYYVGRGKEQLDSRFFQQK